jgi:hypothetical protein
MRQSVTSTEASAPGLFLRAVIERDETLLAALCDADALLTMYRLDLTMRGLGLGVDPWTFVGILDERPAVRKWIGWLADQDLALRRRLGWSTREVDLTVLRMAYQGGDLALVVGAGASMAAGMPGWSQLASRLVERALWYGTRSYRRTLLETFRANRRRAPSSRTVVAAVEEQVFFPDDEEAYRAAADRTVRPPAPAVRARLRQARRALAGQRRADTAALLEAGEAVREALGAGFYDVLRSELSVRLTRTSLHPSIARMVRPRGQHGLTPRVFEILTYNFDDLLEKAIREAGYESTVHFTRGAVAGSLTPNPAGAHRAERPIAVRIVHVHGFVPRWWDAYAFTPLQDVDFVLTESQFRAAYGEAPSWTQRRQEGVFGNAPCLFIGSSLQDDDAVAQLSDAHARRPGWFSYAFMRLPKAHRRHPEQLTGSELEELEAPYRRLGLRIIWVTDHDEIPEILDTISGPPAGFDAEHYCAARVPIEAIVEPHVARAALDLGILLAQQGDPEGARELFERVTPKEPEWPRAQNCLGVLLTEQRDFAGAEAAYRNAIETNDPEQTPVAANKLGVLLAAQGDSQGAKAAFERAAHSAHPREGPGGIRNLRVLAERTQQTR